MRSCKTLFACLMTSLSFLLNAQIIQMTIIPSNDYTLSRRDEWKVVVNNTTNQTLKVFFHGTATEMQRGKIYEVRSLDRQILPGSTIFSTQYFVGLEPFTVLHQDQTLKQYAIKTNGLPAGDYEICITAYSAVDSAELGSTCYSFSADYFTPPILVSPEDKDTVREEYPFFTWLPPVPNNGQNFTYTLSIYELQNVETVISAVQINPPFYEKKGIPVPIAQYGINARNLRPGKRYAWKVSAEVNNQTVATSEVWSFIFMKDNSFTFSNDTSAKKKATKRNDPVPGIPYMELKVQTRNDYSVMDDGKLNFVFVNNLEQDKIGYRILDSKMQQVASEVLDANYGFNYYSLDMKTGGKLLSGKFYELQVTDTKGNILKARFKFISQP